MFIIWTTRPRNPGGDLGASSGARRRTAGPGQRTLTGTVPRPGRFFSSRGRPRPRTLRPCPTLYPHPGSGRPPMATRTAPPPTAPSGRPSRSRWPAPPSCGPAWTSARPSRPFSADPVPEQVSATPSPARPPRPPGPTSSRGPSSWSRTRRYAADPGGRRARGGLSYDGRLGDEWLAAPAPAGHGRGQDPPHGRARPDRGLPAALLARRGRHQAQALLRGRVGRHRGRHAAARPAPVRAGRPDPHARARCASSATSWAGPRTRRRSPSSRWAIPPTTARSPTSYASRWTRCWWRSEEPSLKGPSGRAATRRRTRRGTHMETAPGPDRGTGRGRCPGGLRQGPGARAVVPRRPGTGVSPCAGSGSRSAGPASP